MTNKAKGTSIRQKIIDKSKKMGVNPRDLETVFLIERLIYMKRFPARGMPEWFSGMNELGSDK